MNVLLCLGATIVTSYTTVGGWGCLYNFETMKNSRPTCQQQPLKWGPRPLGCSGSSSTSPAHSSLWKWGGGRVGRLFAVFSGQPCKRGIGQRELDRNWTLLTCTITCAITEQRPHIHLNTVPLQGRICMQPLYLNSGSASAFLFCRYMQNAKLCKERRELGWSGPSSLRWPFRAFWYSGSASCAWWGEGAGCYTLQYGIHHLLHVSRFEA